MVNVQLDEHGIMPKKAHSIDAGFDIFSPCEFRLWKGESKAIDTGVHIEIPSGYVGFIKSKSGLYMKHGITAEGVIDSGYTGSVVVRLCKDDRDGMTSISEFHVGDKLTQLVILPTPSVELVQVDKLKETERGNGGFGSTGR